MVSDPVEYKKDMEGSWSEGDSTLSTGNKRGGIELYQKKKKRLVVMDFNNIERIKIYSQIYILLSKGSKRVEHVLSEKFCYRKICLQSVSLKRNRLLKGQSGVDRTSEPTLLMI